MQAFESMATGKDPEVFGVIKSNSDGGSARGPRNLPKKSRKAYENRRAKVARKANRRA